MSRGQTSDSHLAIGNTANITNDSFISDALKKNFCTILPNKYFGILFKLAIDKY